MDKALSLLQKFAIDARSGRISQDRLRFGAPWRHPPPTNNPTLLLEWAKIQLLDFVQSLVSAEFGVPSLHNFFDLIFSGEIFCVHITFSMDN